LTTVNSFHFFEIDWQCCHGGSGKAPLADVVAVRAVTAHAPAWERKLLETRGDWYNRANEDARPNAGPGKQRDDPHHKAGANAHLRDRGSRIVHGRTMAGQPAGDLGSANRPPGGVCNARTARGDQQW